MAEKPLVTTKDYRDQHAAILMVPEMYSLLAESQANMERLTSLLAAVSLHASDQYAINLAHFEHEMGRQITRPAPMVRVDGDSFVKGLRIYWRMATYLNPFQRRNNLVKSDGTTRKFYYKDIPIPKMRVYGPKSFVGITKPRKNEAKIGGGEKVEIQEENQLLKITLAAEKIMGPSRQVVESIREANRILAKQVDQISKIQLAIIETIP